MNEVNNDWYKDAIIYQVYVRGFQDSTKDGNGDIRGVIERLDYLRDLGVDCLWLMPIFESPLRDDGYGRFPISIATKHGGFLEENFGGRGVAKTFARSVIE